MGVRLFDIAPAAVGGGRHDVVFVEETNEGGVVMEGLLELVSNKRGAMWFDRRKNLIGLIGDGFVATTDLSWGKIRRDLADPSRSTSRQENRPSRQEKRTFCSHPPDRPKYADDPFDRSPPPSSGPPK